MRFVDVSKGIELTFMVFERIRGENLVYIDENKLYDLITNNSLKEKENEYLKKEIEELKYKYNEKSVECIMLEEQVEQLSYKNEELKKKIKTVYELLNSYVDVFSDESAKNDNITYRELLKLDNKDAYYMANATKTVIQILREELE